MDYYFMGSAGDAMGQPKTSPTFEDDSVLTGVEAAELNSGHPALAANQPIMDQALRDQYTEELKQVDDEIQTLKQVLSSKYARQSFLRRQLGITVINELRNEVKHGIDNLRGSDMYQRTSAAVKTAKDKTSAVIQEKWSTFKLSNTYKTFEDKVGSAYSSVRMYTPFNPLAITGFHLSDKLGLQSQSVDGQPSGEFNADKPDECDHLNQRSEAGNLYSTNLKSNPVVSAGTLQMDPLSLDESNAAAVTLESARSAPTAANIGGQSQRRGKHRGAGSQPATNTVS